MGTRDHRYRVECELRPVAGAELDQRSRPLFRIERAPPGDFLPNIGMSVAGNTLPSGAVIATVDLIVDEQSAGLLIQGAAITLRDGPSRVLAEGVVVGLSRQERPWGQRLS